MTARPPLPPESREVRLVSLPDGLPRPEHFQVVGTPLPRPAAGEVLVRNRCFQVFPALRTVIGGGLQDTPFPALMPGDTLFGAAVGEVVANPGPGGPPVGTSVFHYFGWREYAAVPAAGCVPLDGSLREPVEYLSQGALAYAALTRGAGLRPGDTVFVAGGAGSVGSTAGRTARLLGAGRVIGSTGSPAKARTMTGSLGYDAVVLREPERTFAARLAEAAPGGIDVLVDMVGGAQLRAAVEVARPGARFALVGALSGQLAPDGDGTTAPVGLDSYQLVVKRITMRGISGLDHPEVQEEWNRTFGGWLRSGEITFPHVRIAGMDGAARALHEVIGGRHLGTVVVTLT
ncbi:NADP-dependent oxidoreductase [Streptomyces nitrosporeus]|uniref:NADP-dependent oxidoreductase n=1 Tax=Streptomyces nitrosporeus TaxID=28894 RepID=A0A5J6FKA5_9ACTN|nr:NADP-dependent oxidoreductase [Streptomyces nitrosporeus]QEU75794.1 NADP-dependent oxidoreductase [Streptomyces nitrosporeus]GGY88232.1 NADP-dependent oxidoreductase [Streptomyces nitrosporeus]